MPIILVGGNQKIETIEKILAETKIEAISMCRSVERKIVSYFSQSGNTEKIAEEAPMPYLHLDLPGTYPAEVKRELATRLCRLYADIMKTQLWRPNVGIAELGKDNLYHLGTDGLGLVHCRGAA